MSTPSPVLICGKHREMAEEVRESMMPEYESKYLHLLYYYASTIYKYLQNMEYTTLSSPYPQKKLT